MGEMIASEEQIVKNLRSLIALDYDAIEAYQAAIDRLHSALDQVKHHTGSVGYLILLVALLAGGFLAGSSGLAGLERRLRPRTPPMAGGAGAAAATASEAEALANELDVARRRTLRMCLTIAGAIGIHNFGEGLAIGVSARAGAISLATVLIIGFALHNATEGFGIVGPLGAVRPSWGWLGLAGLIGGGPTFLGTLVGYSITSQALEVAFYAIAGGAIIYVIGEIWNAMRRYGHRELGLLMLSAGFLLGVITDLIVKYGGG